MSAAHTPGPWELGDENGVHAGSVYIAAVKPVSHKLLRSIDQETWNANADLIAAAPDMKEALARYVALDEQRGHNDTALYAQARAAIAKATGAAQ